MIKTYKKGTAHMLVHNLLKVDMTTRQPDNDRKSGNVTIIVDICVCCTTA